MTGLIVNIVIGRHHGAGIGLLHRHFKWKHENVVEFLETKMHRRMIAGPFAKGMPHIVLEGCQHLTVLSLEPLDVAGGQNPDQVGVFPMVSSVRPQRTSRDTSRTGANPWWHPICLASLRISLPTASMSSGFQVEP